MRSASGISGANSLRAIMYSSEMTCIVRAIELMAERAGKCKEKEVKVVEKGGKIGEKWDKMTRNDEK